jgi:hypothetical protein
VRGERPDDFAAGLIVQQRDKPGELGIVLDRNGQRVRVDFSQSGGNASCWRNYKDLLIVKIKPAQRKGNDRSSSAPPAKPPPGGTVQTRVGETLKSVKKAHIRSGFSRTSPKSGILNKNVQVKVLEVKLVGAVERVRFDNGPDGQGWVSRIASNGQVVLEKFGDPPPPQIPAAPAPPPPALPPGAQTTNLQTIFDTLQWYDQDYSIDACRYRVEKIKELAEQGEKDSKVYKQTAAQLEDAIIDRNEYTNIQLPDDLEKLFKEQELELRHIKTDTILHRCLIDKGWAVPARPRTSPTRRGGTASRAIGLHEPPEAEAEATALRNYEDFHSMPRGTATLDQVAGSSAGVSGWTRYEGPGRHRRPQSCCSWIRRATTLGRNGEYDQAERDLRSQLSSMQKTLSDRDRELARLEAELRECKRRAVLSWAEENHSGRLQQPAIARLVQAVGLTLDRSEWLRFCSELGADPAEGVPPRQVATYFDDDEWTLLYSGVFATPVAPRTRDLAAAQEERARVAAEEQRAADRRRTVGGCRH